MRRTKTIWFFVCAALGTACGVAMAASLSSCTIFSGVVFTPKDGGEDAAELCDVMAALHCNNNDYGPGSKCIFGTDNLAWCATGNNCNIAQSCTGNVLDYCGNDGLRFTIDCAEQGHTCGLDSMTGNL